MARQKSNITDTYQEFVDIKFSRNTLRVSPFPPGLYQSIMSDVLAEFPPPTPPLKEIKSFTGTDDNPEKIENYEDPEYVRLKKENETLVEHTFSERVLGFLLDECIAVVDTKKMESDIQRLSKYTKYPEDPIERQAKYITDYILSTKQDYSKVITTSVKLSAAGDEEVMRRIDSFQSDIQRGSSTPGNSPSFSEKESV